MTGSLPEDCGVRDQDFWKCTWRVSVIGINGSLPEECGVCDRDYQKFTEGCGVSDRYYRKFTWRVWCPWPEWPEVYLKTVASVTGITGILPEECGICDRNDRTFTWRVWCLWPGLKEVYLNSVASITDIKIVYLKSMESAQSPTLWESVTRMTGRLPEECGVHERDDRKFTWRVWRPCPQWPTGCTPGGRRWPLQPRDRLQV